MKLKLLLCFLFLNQTLSAQTFTEVAQFTPPEGFWAGSVAFSDVDGDGDSDVLITGQTASGNPTSKMYINDGAGNFTEATGTPFEAVTLSSVTFSDVDGDGDNDVLITGGAVTAKRISKLYFNDGTGSFTEAPNTPFEAVRFSSSAISDVDGDGDNDVLITGENASLEPISKLYLNDGTGSFTEAIGTPFEDIWAGAVAFSDVDGDDDNDVLVTGFNGTGKQISKLYFNDGTGSFTEATGTPFVGAGHGSVAFSDVDGDDDNDVLIIGFNSSLFVFAKLYLNNGTGSFTQAISTPLDGARLGSAAFSDVDSDGDNDILITGENGSFEIISKLYLNNGAGRFTEVTGTPLVGVRFSSAAFSDVDGDGDSDVLITGQNAAFEITSKLYINEWIVSSTDNLKIGFNLDLVPYPNPTTSAALYLSYNSVEAGDVTIRVYNIAGVSLKRQNEFATIGQQTFSIDIASLAPGNYFIELDDGKRKRYAKFLIQ